MPEPQANPQTKAQDVLSNILQGKLNDVQSITPWIVNSNKLNNKILRILVQSLKDQEGWSDANILEVILFFDEAAEKGNLSNDLLKKIKEKPEMVDDMKSYLNPNS